MLRIRGLVIVAFLCWAIIGVALAADPGPPSITSLQDPRLSRRVEIKGGWHPISEVLHQVAAQTGISLGLAASVPDERLFVSGSASSATTVLRELGRLLTDSDWTYAWSSRKSTPSKAGLCLWRTPTDTRKQRAFQEMQLRSRVGKLTQLLQSGPDTWKELMDSDPDLAIQLRQPMHQAAIKLLARLTPAQLTGILAGNPLTLPVASLAPADQQLVRQSIGGMAATISRDADGQTQTLFDARNLERGEVVITAIPSGNEPGALSLSLLVYTEPAGRRRSASGGEVLYPERFPEIANLRAQAATKRAAAATATADRAAGRGRTVTLQAEVSREGKEPRLAAYLREFVRQSGLMVLAYRPKEARGPEAKLPHSLTRVTPAEAMQALCAATGCEWKQTGSLVRVRHPAKHPPIDTELEPSPDRPDDPKR